MSRLMALDHAAFQDLGAHRFHGAVSDDLETLFTILADLPSDRAGVRLRGIDRLSQYLASDGRIGAVAAEVLGDASRPVRAILSIRRLKPIGRWIGTRTARSASSGVSPSTDMVLGP